MYLRKMMETLQVVQKVGIENAGVVDMSVRHSSVYMSAEAAGQNGRRAGQPRRRLGTGAANKGPAHLQCRRERATRCRSCRLGSACQGSGASWLDLREPGGAPPERMPSDTRSLNAAANRAVREFHILRSQSRRTDRPLERHLRVKCRRSHRQKTTKPPDQSDPAACL